MHRWLRPFVDKYLDPEDSLGEVLFGLIMVLTFTLGAGFSAGDGPEATRTLLLSALGCNIAWGIIDGVMYVMSALHRRARLAQFAILVEHAPDEEASVALIRDQLEPELSAFSTAAGRESFYQDVVRVVRNSTPQTTRIHVEDVLGGVASFLLVFLTALPAVIPFMFMTDIPATALLTSNAILIAMLFIIGWRWGVSTHTRPLITGIAMMLIGVSLVVTAQLLGG